MNNLRGKISIVALILMMVLSTSCNKLGNRGALINFNDIKSIKERRPVLIAHRGGVVSEGTPENSIAAIQLAKEMGYSMVEIDIRGSKDGVPVAFHDRNLKEACGLDEKVENLDSNDIVKILYSNSDQTICTLDDALKVCHSLKMGVMLDVKTKGNPGLLQKIVALVKKHGLENSCVTITGNTELRGHLKEVALLTVTQEEFEKVQNGVPYDLTNKFWFGLPEQLPSSMVRPLQKNGALVIPAINTFRYPKEGHYELAKKDIERLNEAGVDGYQIDSVYGPLF